MLSSKKNNNKKLLQFIQKQTKLNKLCGTQLGSINGIFGRAISSLKSQRMADSHTKRTAGQNQIGKEMPPHIHLHMRTSHTAHMLLIRWAACWL